MKVCRECKVNKPLEDFHKRSSSSDGRQYKCKECNKKIAKAWQENNPDKHENYWRARDANVEGRKRSQFKKRARMYGLTPEELQTLLDAADGKCELCGNPPGRYLVVDHCHTKGNVRGILCEQCNQGLGMFKDNTETLKKAINYLNKT